MQDVSVIAGRIRQIVAQGDFLGGFTDLLADKVEVHHHPSIPSDGVKTREEMAAGAGSEAAVFEQLHARVVLDGDVTVDGDTITADLAWEGELPDGPLRVPLKMTYTVENGRIVRLDEHVSTEAIAKLTEVFTALGHQPSGSAH